VDLIFQTAERAANLVRQLLAFSRKRVLERRVLEMNSVVGDMITLLRRLIGQHILLWATRAPDEARVKADVGQIEQVIVNLAINARNAMPDGGRLAIEVANGGAQAEAPRGARRGWGRARGPARALEFGRRRAHQRRRVVTALVAVLGRRASTAPPRSASHGPFSAVCHRVSANPSELL